MRYQIHELSRSTYDFDMVPAIVDLTSWHKELYKAFEMLGILPKKCESFFRIWDNQRKDYLAIELGYEQVM